MCVCMCVCMCVQYVCVQVSTYNMYACCMCAYVDTQFKVKDDEDVTIGYFIFGFVSM